jgi:putative membrane protein
VELSNSHVWEADSWGEGLAPFFISLALWVGALITWLLLRPLQTRALMTSVNGFRMAWGSLNSALLLSLGQVVIMLSVMHFAVGLDPQNVVATLAFSMLAAAAFFALQQFFQVTLGSAVGKVVIIVLLMVQLASAGGTYPIQTTPSFLQAISPYMPMTYVVNGLREAITGGIETRFWTSVAVLAAIFVVSLAATSIASARKRMWTMSRLHPALSI